MSCLIYGGIVTDSVPGLVFTIKIFSSSIHLFMDIVPTDFSTSCEALTIVAQ